MIIPQPRRQKPGERTSDQLAICPFFLSLSTLSILPSFGYCLASYLSTVLRNALLCTTLTGLDWIDLICSHIYTLRYNIINPSHYSMQPDFILFYPKKICFQGWDGCRDRTDGNLNLTSRLQYLKPTPRYGTCCTVLTTRLFSSSFFLLFYDD